MQIVGVVALVILVVVSVGYLFHHIGGRVKKDRNLRDKVQAFKEKILDVEVNWAFLRITGELHEKLSDEEKKKFQKEWDKIWKEYRELDFVTPKTEELVHLTKRKAKYFFSNFFEETA